MQKEVSNYRKNLTSQLRSIYCNLYGEDFVFGKYDFFNTDTGEKVFWNPLTCFDMFENGLINQAQLIQSLQLSARFCTFKKY